jgi:hypothetical protein
MKKVLFFLPFVLIACSKQNQSKKVIWYGGSSEPPQILAPYQKGQAEIKVGRDTVIVERQSVDQSLVENSYTKKILKQNQLVFVNAHYETKISDQLVQQVQKMKSTSAASWLAKLYQEKPFLKDKKLVEDAEISIRLIAKKLQPVIKFNFLENNEEIQSWVFDNSLNLIGVESLGSHFFSAKALVYPEGPKVTKLTSVFLKALTDEVAGLSGEQVHVTTESNQKVSMTDNLNFNPPDEKFDQVQIFYYIQKAIGWFEDHLKIEPHKLHLEAMAHLGYPDKTNASFYYKGTIRLGAGDDVVYSHISYDPSIVTHESSHGLIEMLAALPYQGEGGSLNEGFADFLTCMMLNNSKLGEVSYKKAAFKRDISLVVKFSEKNAGLYHDSAIVSSFFWVLKDKIGADKSLNLALSVLKKLSPFSDLMEYKNILAQTIEADLTNTDLTEAQSLLKNWE